VKEALIREKRRGVARVEARNTRPTVVGVAKTKKRQYVTTMGRVNAATEQLEVKGENLETGKTTIKTRE